MTETEETKVDNGMLIERTKTFWIILLFAVLQVGIGAFVLYGNTRITNIQDEQERFITCQAQYNQDFRETYDAITEASRQTQGALFDFLSLTPSVLTEKTTSEDIVRFRQKSEDYVRFYKDLQSKRVTEKYPDPPKDFCAGSNDDHQGK